jgi:hypothetical protein
MIPGIRNQSSLFMSEKAVSIFNKTEEVKRFDSEVGIETLGLIVFRVRHTKGSGAAQAR